MEIWSHIKGGVINNKRQLWLF